MDGCSPRSAPLPNGTVRGLAGADAVGGGTAWRPRNTQVMRVRAAGGAGGQSNQSIDQAMGWWKLEKRPETDLRSMSPWGCSRCVGVVGAVCGCVVCRCLRWVLMPRMISWPACLLAAASGAIRSRRPATAACLLGAGGTSRLARTKPVCRMDGARGERGLVSQRGGRVGAAGLWCRQKAFIIRNRFQLDRRRARANERGEMAQQAHVCVFCVCVCDCVGFGMAESSDEMVSISRDPAGSIEARKAQLSKCDRLSESKPVLEWAKIETALVRYSMDFHSYFFFFLTLSHKQPPSPRQNCNIRAPQSPSHPSVPYTHFPRPLCYTH